MISNIDRYLAFMAEANVSGADIIVFPEYGVTGTIVSEMKDRVKAREFMVVGEVGRKRVEHGSDVKFGKPMGKEIIIVFYLTDLQPWR